MMFVVNGAPVAIVDHKNPTDADTIEWGVTQLRRYEIETPELMGAAQLFNVTHLLDSRNVVTYHLRDKNPATASNNQFDFAFASRGFHESIKVRAMNGIDEWGASDHCRLLIEITDGATPAADS